MSTPFQQLIDQIILPTGAGSGTTRIVIGTEVPPELVTKGFQAAILFYVDKYTPNQELGYYFIGLSKSVTSAHTAGLVIGEVVNAGGPTVHFFVQYTFDNSRDDMTAQPGASFFNDRPLQYQPTVPQLVNLANRLVAANGIYLPFYPQANYGTGFVNAQLEPTSYGMYWGDATYSDPGQIQFHDTGIGNITMPSTAGAPYAGYQGIDRTLAANFNIANSPSVTVYNEIAFNGVENPKRQYVFKGKIRLLQSAVGVNIVTLNVRKSPGTGAAVATYNFTLNTGAALGVDYPFEIPYYPSPTIEMATGPTNYYVDLSRVVGTATISVERDLATNENFIQMLDTGNYPS